MTIVTTVIEKRALSDDVVFICDFSPPRGSYPQLLDPAKQLDADFISVAYNPGRSVRASSAFVAHWIKQNTGKEVLFTLATRDMNKVAIQSLLLGAALLGLENVVLLRGDAFTERDLEGVSPVNDYRPTELLRSVTQMNAGLDYRGLKLRSSTGFCVGASIDLAHGIEHEIELTRRKVEAGAKYFLLQAIFEPVRLQEFLDGYARKYREDLSPPVFCGIQVMSQESIVFGDIPRWVTDDLGSGRPGDEIALQVLGEFVGQGFKSIYLIPPILKGGRRDYDAAQRVLDGFSG